MTKLTDNNIVSLQDISFSHADKLIFRDVNLNIVKGKITAIMGPSGCGKTTLLKLITGLLRPDSGQVYLRGVNITTASRSMLYKSRRCLGMLFQSGALFTDLSVFANVAFPIREHTDLPESMIKDLVLIKLQAVGLRGAADLMPRELSGGMARRVALARAISLDPELMMFDEPFAGQDPVTMGVLATLIKRLNGAMHMTSIVVSHDIQETLAIADYVCVMGNQQLLTYCTPEQLLQSQDPWLRQFVRGYHDGPIPFHCAAKNYAEELRL